MKLYTSVNKFKNMVLNRFVMEKEDVLDIMSTYKETHWKSDFGEFEGNDHLSADKYPRFHPCFSSLQWIIFSLRTSSSSHASARWVFDFRWRFQSHGHIRVLKLLMVTFNSKFDISLSTSIEHRLTHAIMTNKKKAIEIVILMRHS